MLYIYNKNNKIDKKRTLILTRLYFLGKVSILAYHNHHNYVYLC